MRDFRHELNPSQYEAATAPDGPTLVIAGAGSGKTRTIVYRLAHLVQHGVTPSSILLLTFTRKASQEMLKRAGEILGHGHGLSSVRGGTFHSFAFTMLRQFGSLLGFQAGFTLMDQSDAEDAVDYCKKELGLGKGTDGKADKSFPKKGTIHSLISGSRNKEVSLDKLLEREPHLQTYSRAIIAIAKAYEEYKRTCSLMDYDDLLFGLDRLLEHHAEFRDFLGQKVRHVLVDEYQDTNLVQARIVRRIAGEAGNVMAVGDDAQSIYAFRGANVRNILDFPTHFPGTTIVRLEQNYRSTQPILDLTNKILAGSAERFDKNLFSDRRDGEAPILLRPGNDRDQAQIIVGKIRALSSKYPLHEIAVLFRASYHSFHLEAALSAARIPFQKYGGKKLVEAAHIKDVLSFLRLVMNPSDRPAWIRVCALLTGVGDKTAIKVHDALMSGNNEAIAKAKPEIRNLIEFLDKVRGWDNPKPAMAINAVMEFYEPLLVANHADDHPQRLAALDQFAEIAQGYDSIESLLADMILESPDEKGNKDAKTDVVVLSTVHSSKGLEWRACFVIDLIEDRFPSKHAQKNPEDLEEERRLLYVACTRAKDELYLSVPCEIFNRAEGVSAPTVESRFVSGLMPSVQSAVSTQPVSKRPVSYELPPILSTAPGLQAKLPERLGFCTHRVFGRGRVIEKLGPDKFLVNFPGHGQKTILRNYLTME